jgi:hypothetical protein
VSGGDRHLSALDLDVLEISGGGPAEEDHLARCEACRAKRDLRREQAEAFYRQRLPRLLVRQAQNRPARRWALVAWLAAGASLAMVLALLWPRTSGRPDRAAGDDLGIKGWEPPLRAIVRRGSEIFEIQDGDRLAPGDALRFVVAAPPHRHLLVASVDGAGAVSVYFPYRGTGSAALDGPGPVEVPSGSIVLDRAPGPERVFAIFSAEPLDSEPVRVHLEALGRRGAEAIRRETRLPLPGTLQLSLHFEKAEELR